MSTDLTLLHTTKEVAYEAIKQYGGQQLQFCTKELQDDASTVVFAVSKYGKAIR